MDLPTFAATIPLAMSEACQEGNIDKGDRIVLCAFGAGDTWYSVLLRWALPRLERMDKTEARAGNYKRLATSKLLKRRKGESAKRRQDLFFSPLFRKFLCFNSLSHYFVHWPGFPAIHRFAASPVQPIQCNSWNRRHLNSPCRPPCS